MNDAIGIDSRFLKVTDLDAHRCTATRSRPGHQAQHIAFGYLLQSLRVYNQTPSEGVYVLHRSISCRKNIQKFIDSVFRKARKDDPRDQHDGGTAEHDISCDQKKTEVAALRLSKGDCKDQQDPDKSENII